MGKGRPACPWEGISRCLGGVTTGTEAPGGQALYPPSPLLSPTRLDRAAAGAHKGCGSLRAHSLDEGESACTVALRHLVTCHLDSDLVGVTGRIMSLPPQSRMLNF